MARIFLFLLLITIIIGCAPKNYSRNDNLKFLQEMQGKDIAIILSSCAYADTFYKEVYNQNSTVIADHSLVSIVELLKQKNIKISKKYGGLVCVEHESTRRKVFSYFGSKNFKEYTFPLFVKTPDAPPSLPIIGKFMSKWFYNETVKPVFLKEWTSSQYTLFVEINSRLPSDFSSSLNDVTQTLSYLQYLYPVLGQLQLLADIADARSDQPKKHNEPWMMSAFIYDNKSDLIIKQFPAEAECVHDRGETAKELKAYSPNALRKCVDRWLQNNQ
jgi:hypothetical protein